MRGYKANAIPSAPGADPGPEASSASGAPSADGASGKAPESRRLDAERRRELLSKLASTVSKGELRAIQAEVIAAYLGMAARRVSSETDVERVRDAARVRLRRMHTASEPDEARARDAHDTAPAGEDGLGRAGD